MKWLLTVLLAAKAAFAGAPASPLPLEVPTRHLSAPLHAEVHLPGGYDASQGRRYPVCLLLHGGGGSARELRGLGLARLATAFGIIIVVPDAGPGLFADSPGAALESAILADLLPEVDRRFRTSGSARNRMAAGISLGGYAALHMGLRQPGAFGRVVSLSGVVECPRWTALEESFLPAAMRDQLDRAFGPPGSGTRLAVDLSTMVKDLPLPARKALPFLRLDCGEEDLFLPSNRRLAALFAELGVRHQLRTTPGGHDDLFWRRQLEEALGAMQHPDRSDDEEDQP